VRDQDDSATCKKREKDKIPCILPDKKGQWAYRFIGKEERKKAVSLLN
jgi:hypothetical protein